jgi:hypothetical protein
MANHHRGEIDCQIGGRRLRLCLTLGALAEIEASFGCDGLAALGERLSSGRMGAGDLVALIGAAARGAGETISDAELRALPLSAALPDMVAATARVLRLAFAPDESDAPDEAQEGASPNPRSPQA